MQENTDQNNSEYGHFSRIMAISLHEKILSNLFLKINLYEMQEFGLRGKKVLAKINFQKVNFGSH